MYNAFLIKTVSLDKKWSIYITIVTMLILLCYTYQRLPQTSFSFMDDSWMLLHNKYVYPKNYSITYLVNIFKRINDIQYSPLNTLYYSLIFKINGFDPYYYHLCNLVIHFFNSVLILVVSDKVLTIFKLNNSYLIACMVGIIWSIHPLNVEPVIWVSGSKILLCTLLTLLSMLFFINAILTSKKTINYLLSFSFFILSLFIKEQAIMTPFMFFSLLLFEKQGNPFKRKWNYSSLFFCIFCIVISVIFGWFTLKYVNNISDRNFTPITSYSLDKRFFFFFYCLRFYVINLLFPINLHYHYPYPIGPLDHTPLLYLLFPLFVVPFCIYLFLIIKKSRLSRFYLFCISIFFIQIILELQIVPMTRPAITADRYMYLPSVGLILAAFVYTRVMIQSYHFPHKIKRLVTTCCIIYFIFLFSYSHQLVKDWQQYNIIQNEQQEVNQ